MYKYMFPLLLVLMAFGVTLIIMIYSRTLDLAIIKPAVNMSEVHHVIESPEKATNMSSIHYVINKTEPHGNSRSDVTVPVANSGDMTTALSPPVMYLSAKLVGRLGNQMFIYAALLGLARAQKRIPFISGHSDLVKMFQVTHVNTNINTTGWPVISESGYARFNVKFMKLPNVNLFIAGYLQCWRYFLHAQDYIRKEFTLKPHIQEEVDSVLVRYRAEFINNVLVGVHVRRGDMLLTSSANTGYGVANGSYFMRAFSKIRSYLPNQNVTFLIASDDIEWCTKNIKDSSVRFLPPGNATTHFALLTSCDHVIISSGTYGWWSAWLANGITIYYKNFVTNNTPLQKGFDYNDYYPPGWIGLDY